MKRDFGLEDRPRVGRVRASTGVRCRRTGRLGPRWHARRHAACVPGSFCRASSSIRSAIGLRCTTSRPRDRARLHAASRRGSMAFPRPAQSPSRCARARNGTRRARVGTVIMSSSGSFVVRSSHEPPQTHISRWVLVLFIMLAAAVLFWIWSPAPQTRAIRDLPASDRHVLYERTLATLRSPCNPDKGADGLLEYCRQQAEFIVQFPECDAACATLAKRFLVTPAR